MLQSVPSRICAERCSGLCAELPTPHPTGPNQAPAPAPAAATYFLCEPCMASCGLLTLQGPNPYLNGETISPQVCIHDNF